MSNMLEYRGYHATIEFDAEDGIFIGEVFGISDSLNFHGTSVDELTQMFHQSIDNYLELCENIGKDPDKEFKGSFNIRVSPTLHKKAALEALKKGISLNQYIENCIEQSFEDNKHNTTEKIIYIPYTEKMVSFENENTSNSNYVFKNEYETLRKEDITYAEGLS